MSGRKTVLMDVDGVLADFAVAALELVRQLTGKRYKPEDVTTWEVFDSIPEPQAKAEVYRIMKAPGGCTAIPVYPEARDGIERLREVADIIAVTSPFKGSPTWAHEREEWLTAHFGSAISYVISSRHKDRVHGDFLVDDKPEHVRDWLRYWRHAGRNPSAIPMLWRTYRTLNEPVEDGIISVSNWNEVYDLVRDGVVP